MTPSARAKVVRALRAAAVALGASKPRLRVFDCDETLLVSYGAVTVTKPNGEVIRMDSATFAHFKPVEGDKLDFGAFNHVRRPRKIKKTFEHFKQCIENGDRVAILTARAKGAESAIRKFLEHEGVDVSKVQIVGLGSSNPYDKARWIDKVIEDGGHDDVEFYDDSHANANAVAEHGKKFHTAIKFTSTNVRHPHEEDFDGPAIEKDFDSDDPADAVVEYKPRAKAQGESDKTDAPKKKAASDWWDAQTESFKKGYCKDHPNSGYCRR